MALTRRLLRGMNLTDEQVDTIIEAHSETVDGLKSDIEKYKVDAEKLPGVQRELDDLKRTVGDGGEVVPKADFDRLQGEFDTYKSEVTAREARSAKEAAYRALLKEAGIDAKRHDAIVKITDVDSIELAEDGKIKDAESRTAQVKTDYADFIVTYGEKGADVSTPPVGNGDGADITKEQFNKMSYKDRLKIYNEDQELYNKLTS